MGISILELVLRRLREENFSADVAYPGQKFPSISGAVAAVHIEKVDRANQTVTVEVNIICPAAMGGTACEVEALRATEVLRWTGAVCIQNGCSYDGVAQVYCVSILATFTAVTEADDCTMGPGFSIYINNLFQYDLVSFSAEEIRERSAEFSMGETAAIGVGEGSVYWKLRLEELIPAGSPETDEPVGAFELKVETAVKTEIFQYCQWTSIHREFTKQGLRRIRTGIAMLREEVSNGEAEL